MPATKVQLQGGPFVDPMGNVLANGYLKMVLSQDGTVPGVSLVGAGVEITITLDANGNVSTSQAQSVWGNDVLSPINTYYRVTGYTAQGQPAWGRNNQQVIGGPTFDVGQWVPNQVFSWIPSVAATQLEVNDVPNTVQGLLNLEGGANITLTDEGDGGVTIAASTGLPATGVAQTGDSLRWNVTGDGKWDATQSGFRNAVTVYEGAFASAPSIYGAISNGGAATLGTRAVILPNATDSTSASYTSSSSASTNTVIGGQFGGGANIGSWGFGSFYRWSFRFKPGNTSNVRYWFGQTVFDTGGLSGEHASTLSGTSMASDTPGRHLLGFRYSAGTDTTWMAVGSTGTTQTATSTGVALDTTNPHLFEITYDGTTARYFIDGVQVTQVTTNLPAVTQAKTVMFWCGDNKNTATAISGTFAWMSMELK